MSFFVIATGIVLLLVCLAGIVLGAYMASDRKTREPGVLFALCWVSGAAGAVGVIMLDAVTALVGVLCFLAASGSFLFFGDGGRVRPTRERGGAPEPPEGSEKTTKENRTTGYRRREAS